MTVEAMVAMSTTPMAASAPEADEYAGAITVDVPAVAAPMAPAAMAMAERSEVHGLGNGSLAAKQEILRRCRGRRSGDVREQAE